MRALSIKQPWLYAVTDLDKRIENRTRKPPTWLLGERIALHASKKQDISGHHSIAKIAGVQVPQGIPLGCIVATAQIAGWLHKDGSGEGVKLRDFLSLLAYDKWFFGPVGWIFQDVQKLNEPIPCRGALGLWYVPQEMLAAVTGDENCF